MSIGDPAGIGAEVVAKSWERRREEGLPPFFAVGDVTAVEAVWNGPIAIIGEPADVYDHFDHALPLIRVTGGKHIDWVAVVGHTPGSRQPASVDRHGSSA